MILSIHQPNFMPWVPFFDKMRMCDVFVLLTHCQFEKNGYQNRFQMDNKWWTMRVVKSSINTEIAGKHYVSPHEDWERIKRSLRGYSRTLSMFDDCISEKLADTNTSIIRKIAASLGIKTEIFNDNPTTLHSTERLVDICKQYGADTYIAGAGGRDYMDLSLFERAGITVRFHEVLKQELPILKVLA